MTSTNLINYFEENEKDLGLQKFPRHISINNIHYLLIICNTFEFWDKLRAYYQHACLQYVSGEKMTNESLRVRFNIEKKNAAIASRILSDATLSGLIKEYQPNSESRRYKSYLPYWA